LRLFRGINLSIGDVSEMVDNNKIVAFIPVRGGSKSIPLKNIKEINGRPLVYWVVDAAINCKYIDKVFISTDSDLIRSKIEEYKNNYRTNKNIAKLECIDRSSESASDTASTEAVILEFAERYNFKNVVLIQATSPLLTAEDLDIGVCTYKEGNFDSILSVTRQKRFIWSEEPQNKIVPVNYDPLERPRRQDFNGYLVENGAFYITTKEQLLLTKCRISGNIGYYEMGEESYFEIDEPSDWIIVEQFMKGRNSKIEMANNLKNIKLVAMDCDGVLTDGGMYYTEDGNEIKKFNTRDGMGIGLLHKQGIKTAIITGEDTKIVMNRAKKLGIDEVILGCKDKLTAMKQLVQKYNLSFNEVSFIGDDINDIELLENVGVSFSVSDAMQIVKSKVDYVTSKKGGQGAVREVAEIIIKSQWQES
jgi:YrbI family 3-deoxy-D-manno-octulosonate 8-phosphate phosphatase